MNEYVSFSSSLIFFSLKKKEKKKRRKKTEHKRHVTVINEKETFSIECLCFLVDFLKSPTDGNKILSNQ